LLATKLLAGATWQEKKAAPAQQQHRTIAKEDTLIARQAVLDLMQESIRNTDAGILELEKRLAAAKDARNQMVGRIQAISILSDSLIVVKKEALGPAR